MTPKPKPIHPRPRPVDARDEDAAHSHPGRDRPEADRAVARRVIEAEAQGLHALADGLDISLSQALDLLANVAGRVVVTGMGKSGHVARKIAATLASTGTPAQFVHPAEASHGDLGMITPADAVIALSNSGETAEMSDLVAYTRRFSIPLIALTGRGESAIAQAADVTLLLPVAPEACPLGLAPTTSTAVMLALGDALAVALFERKGFSSDDFHQFHPKGALGRKFLRVADLMHRGSDVPLVAAGTRMAEAMIEMTGKRFGCVGVTDANGRLLGIVTDGDLRRHMAPNLLEATAETVMTANPLSIRSRALAAEALGLMNARSVTALFVIDDHEQGSGPPVGILHVHDILRAGIV
ncbi:MAG: KpsF/GutQ family sugar-phosphate isomerase [Rhodospirillales bacterium]|nr:KpsF/GutQ family sugar-phosphate isomerase [Rhodospirillales bacterium]